MQLNRKLEKVDKKIQQVMRKTVKTVLKLTA